MIKTYPRLADRVSKMQIRVFKYKQPMQYWLKIKKKISYFTYSNSLFLILNMRRNYFIKS